MIAESSDYLSIAHKAAVKVYDLKTAPAFYQSGAVQRLVDTVKGHSLFYFIHAVAVCRAAAVSPEYEIVKIGGVALTAIVRKISESLAFIQLSALCKKITAAEKLHSAVLFAILFSPELPYLKNIAGYRIGTFKVFGRHRPFFSVSCQNNEREILIVF